MTYSFRGVGQNSSGNGLVPDGTKPLPGTILTYHQWYIVAFTWRQFHREMLKISNHKTTFEKNTFYITEPSPRGQWVKVSGSSTQFMGLDALSRQLKSMPQRPRDMPSHECWCLIPYDHYFMTSWGCWRPDSIWSLLHDVMRMLMHWFHMITTSWYHEDADALIP